MPDLPLLICAQSGRFLAQAAHREGLTVWVVDSYADQDTLQATDRYLQIPSLETLTESALLKALSSISASTPCYLMISTGIERFYPILDRLPAHIHSLGNDLETLKIVCEPDNWFKRLSDLNIPFPKVQSNPQSGFLFKASQQWGGQHIRHTAPSTYTKGYFQQFINGRALSALFIAAGSDCQLLAINEQHCRNTARGDFTLAAIRNHGLLSAKELAQITAIIHQLSASLALRGFNSLDMMLSSDGALYVLELNPRPSASLALLDTTVPIITWHSQSSIGRLPDTAKIPTSSPKRLLYCFADKNKHIPAQHDWPEYCSDLPMANSLIKKDAIVCSVLLELANVDINDLAACHQYLQKLLNSLPDAT